MQKEELIAFTEDIKALFNDGKIKSPVHLSLGNEDALIDIFKDIKRDDWVFSTHRNHYHALLKGIPAEWLKKEILDNHSIHINNAEYKFFSSAIVGGCCSIALGVALGLKRKNAQNCVWCFVGDMASMTGVFNECVRYAQGFDLPITYVVEDNGLSVNTPSYEVWGKGDSAKMIVYEYERVVPHAGSGKWIAF